MKRIARLLVPVLLSAIPLYAGDKGKTAEMSGFLCNSKCVSQSASHASCNTACADKGGEVILVDEMGQIFKIANQDKVVANSGKKVKLKGRPIKHVKDTIYVDHVRVGG
jgi:hypothetical protein